MDLAALTSCCSYLHFRVLKTGSAELCVCMKLLWWPLLLRLKGMLGMTLWIRHTFLPFLLLFILAETLLLTYFIVDILGLNSLLRIRHLVLF